MSRMFETFVNMMSQFKGLTAADYCHLETSAGKDAYGEHHPCLLMTTGGLISAIDINGLNRLVGAEESREAHATLTEVLSLAMSGGHEIDWGYCQNSLESQSMLKEFFDPQKNTAKQIGLTIDRQLDASKEVLGHYVRPEHNMMYIITPPRKINDKEQMAKLKEIAGAYMQTFDQHRPAQGFASALTYSEQLRIEHNAMVQTIQEKLARAGYTIKRLGAREIPWAIRRDASYETPAKWEPWLWGDPVSLRSTPEDRPGENKLINWGGPSLGMQIHDQDVQPTGRTGIAKVGKYYVAPLLVELLPDREAWITELLSYLPVNLPLRYRVYCRKNKSMFHWASEMLARVSDFSKKHLPENHEIAQAFNYVAEMEDRKIDSGCVSITMCTWHTDLKQLTNNLEELKSKVSAWGRTQLMVERGDLAEAVIATIPGFSTTLFAPAALESVANIAKLIPHTRPASPFPNGTTPLRTPCGKMWAVSPISSVLPAYIELIVAGSGAGKSVQQNAINRDANLKAGNRGLNRHVTIDIGPSGKGTVAAIRSQLPPNRAHEAVYERLSVSIRHAFNPMDLQLGARTPTPLDRAFVIDFVTMLATPQGRKEPTKLMAELVAEVVDSAYEYAFNPETATLYESGINPEVDKALNQHPDTNDPGFWGMRHTWLKVTDFLFKAGNYRAAMVAQRYVVPIVPDLPRIMSGTANIMNRYSKAGEGGISLTDEFATLISSSAKNYPLLTSPTAIDFDSARYLVLDLNDVTQNQDSQQTGVMYALAAQMGTRDFWLNQDDLTYFREEYRDYTLERIKRIRDTDLGVTFEEFRRTQKQPKVRAMVNRWMAEGRKWRVRVQVVMQQPDHADAEMFGHATMMTFMGTWNGQMLAQLEKMEVKLSESEKHALLRRVHGPGAAGSSMLIRYNLKSSGWGSQLVYMTKSPVELWSSTTAAEDVRVREIVEDLVGDPDLANAILCARYPKGSVVEVVEQEAKKAAELGTTEESIFQTIAEKAIKSWKLLHAA